MNSRSSKTALSSFYAKCLSVSLGISTEILFIINVIVVDLELTWQYLATEQVLLQTRVVCVNRFHLLQWLLVQYHSFQPSLGEDRAWNFPSPIQGAVCSLVRITTGQEGRGTTWDLSYKQPRLVDHSLS